MTDSNQPIATAWIAENSAGESCACFGFLSEGSIENALDNLRSSVFVDENVCYLCATDGHALVETDAVNCVFSLFVPEKILFSMTVDASWATAARAQGGVWWIATDGEIGPKQMQKLSVVELLESTERGEVEIIAVAIGNQS